MKNNLNQIPFGKAFLAALFAGILATLVCFVFDIFYRMDTLYGPTDYINVSSIIFIVNILLLVAGVAYYAIKSWSKRGDLIYSIFFLLVFGFCFWKIAGIQRFSDLQLNKEFIQLLGGTVIIIGVAILSIPYFFNNKRIVDFYYEANI
jgi:hypothetical protein